MAAATSGNGFADCATVDKQLRSLAAAGKTTVGCVSRGSADRKPLDRSLFERAPFAARTLAPADVPAGWTRTTDPLIVPNWCDITQLATYRRLRECHADTILYQMKKVPEGTVVGTAVLPYVEWEELSNKQRSWTHQIRMYVNDINGAAYATTFLNAEGFCGFLCTVDLPPEKAYYLLDKGDRFTGSWKVTSPNDGEVTVINYQKTDTDFFFLNILTGLTRAGTALEYASRCDSVLPQTTREGGCVYDGVIPEVLLDESSTSAYRLHAQFVDAAQLSTPDHYGARRMGDQPQPLHRMIDKEQEEKNRNESCRGFVKQNADDSCDEYPTRRPTKEPR